MKDGRTDFNVSVNKQILVFMHSVWGAYKINTFLAIPHTLYKKLINTENTVSLLCNTIYFKKKYLLVLKL